MYVCGCEVVRVWSVECGIPWKLGMGGPLRLGEHQVGERGSVTIDMDSLFGSVYGVVLSLM